MMPFHYCAKVAAVCGFSLLVLLPRAWGGVENLQPGDTREVVIQELSSAFSSMKFGSFETLVYKDGTSVSLKNGLVTEVRPGKQIITEFRTGASSRHLQAAAPQNDRSQNRPEPTTNAVPEEPGVSPQLEGKAPVSKPAAATSITPAKPSGSVDNRPPHSHPAIAQSPRPATARLSTNLVPGSVSRMSKRTPVAITFSGGSGKALNPVVAFSWLTRLARGFAVLFLGFVIGLYLFICHCSGRICQKAGIQPGVLIWIPVAQCIPLLRVARLPLWALILMFVPVVNIVLLFTVWAKICIALGKTPWLVVLLLVPLANLGLIVYLAFSDASAQAAQPKAASDDKIGQPEAVAV